jgi:hypothetical protein
VIRQGKKREKKKREKWKIFDEEALLGAKELSHSRFIVLFDARERSFPSRFVKGVFWQRLFSSPLGRSQESSRTKVRPSPSGIFFDLQSGLWSKHWGSDC